MKQLILRKNEKKEQLTLLLIFVLSYSIVSFFHEPWFDEAQSWLIGRDASYYDMLVTIPHDEGHPAFWWLLLSVLAKTGVPFELGLKMVGLAISASSVWLILHKSPYPKYFKYILPFTYFVFYQYGIIVRPYGLMLLFFLLLALNFKFRKNHPYRFVFLLILLCLTGAYGLLMAGGIALALCIDFFHERKFSINDPRFWDSRTKALFLLLIIAVLIVIQITPNSNAVGSDSAHTAVNPLWIRIICMFFTVLPDCFITQSSWFFRDRYLLQNAEITWYDLVVCLLIGLIIWAIIFSLSSHKNFKFFILPYALFACFGAIVYFNGHHIGVAFNLFLFWLWIALEDQNKLHGWNILKNKICKNSHDSLILKKGGLFFISACLFISMYWSISSSIQDIRLQYSYGRETSAFLKENNLDKATIFCGWLDNSSSNMNSSPEPSVSGVNTSLTSTPTVIMPYFTHNIVENYNNGHEAFLHQHYSTNEENLNNFLTWKSLNPPDVLLDKINNMEALFNHTVTMKDYSPVYIMQSNYIWKGSVTTYEGYVYLRNDLLKKYKMNSVTSSNDILPSYFKFTDEQIEGFRNGTLSLEDIMPFLEQHGK